MVAEVFKSQPVSITADETADVRDHSILNVIASVHGKPYLMGLSIWKHATIVQ